jgi:hypothetical protein
MTQRNNHTQIASNPGRRPVAALREARAMRLADVLIKIAPLSALILVLVLITGLASAEYGFV